MLSAQTGVEARSLLLGVLARLGVGGRRDAVLLSVGLATSVDIQATHSARESGAGAVLARGTFADGSSEVELVSHVDGCVGVWVVVLFQVVLRWREATRS